MARPHDSEFYPGVRLDLIDGKIVFTRKSDGHVLYMIDAANLSIEPYVIRAIASNDLTIELWDAGGASKLVAVNNAGHGVFSLDSKGDMIANSIQADLTGNVTGTATTAQRLVAGAVANDTATDATLVIGAVDGRIRYTATAAYKGTAGHAITVAHDDLGADGTSLSCVVTGTDIVIKLAKAGGLVTTTPQQILAALAGADPGFVAAAALVSGSFAGLGTGTDPTAGAVAAPLAGAVDTVAGTAGDIRWASGFLNVCVTTGTAQTAVWQRVAIAGW